MKKLLFLLFGLFVFSTNIRAQDNKEFSSSISKAEIIGVWQFGTIRIGNGLGEYFKFFPDGKFIYAYNTDDDTRNIIKLYGTYRLNDNGLFLTIESRLTRVGGKIAAGAGGTDEELFTFDNDLMKRIQEVNPKELDPLQIQKNNKRVLNTISIKVNNRVYYKLSSNPNKFAE